MRQRVVRLVLCAALLASGFGNPARAAVFDFTFATTVASGQITTAGPFVGGQALVTGIYGVFNGFPITGLLPNNTARFSTDNVLHEAAPFVDPLGIIFGTSNDGTVANVFHTATGADEIGACTQTVIAAGRCFEGSPDLTVSLGTFSIAPAAVAVTEPPLPALLGAGLLALWLLRRRPRST